MSRMRLPGSGFGRADVADLNHVEGASRLVGGATAGGRPSEHSRSGRDSNPQLLNIGPSSGEVTVACSADVTPVLDNGGRQATGGSATAEREGFEPFATELLAEFG